MSAFVFVLLLVGSARATPIDTRERENVAAFARLYGTVRWFHPSDGAQKIDWNRYAVYGVERVRSARSPRALRRELLEKMGTRKKDQSALSTRTHHAGKDGVRVAFKAPKLSLTPCLPKLSDTVLDAGRAQEPTAQGCLPAFE